MESVYIYIYIEGKETTRESKDGRSKMIASLRVCDKQKVSTIIGVCLRYIWFSSCIIFFIIIITQVGLILLLN